MLVLCAMTRRWVIAPDIGLPLAAIGALWLWLVLAGCWSASGAVLAAKLPEIILLGPIMLLAGLVVAGDETVLRGFCAGVLGAGAAVAARRQPAVAAAGVAGQRSSRPSTR
jgi:hypothetical protein